MKMVDWEAHNTKLGRQHTNTRTDNRKEETYYICPPLPQFLPTSSPARHSVSGFEQLLLRASLQQRVQDRWVAAMRSCGSCCELRSVLREGVAHRLWCLSVDLRLNGGVSCQGGGGSNSSINN